MGSNSRSNSSQTTNNTSTTFGIQGDNLGIVLNGDGNNIIDGGAFEIVGRLVDILPGIFTDSLDTVNNGFGTVEELAMIGADQNENFLNAGLDLFGGVANAQSEMMQLGMSSLTETGSILSDGFHEFTDASQRTNAAALDFSQSTTETAFDFGRDAIDANTGLAELVADSLTGTAENMAELANDAMMQNADLSAVSIDAIENAHSTNAQLAERAISSAENVTGDSQKLLTSGFNDMLGLMERFSRSDGANLADGNNKTILMLFGGVSVTVIIVALIATRSKK
ncbi:hypothetical protein BEL05_04895 [Shewanella colwelliana]|uniref:Uncharacterized protein n=1 Tax=Shewanella colwelliana TaxID=23 RepID=A0A1E5IPB0_SHECO|nr:hypothetical protein [Shewanella colwelliana]OEG72317.1 hypothetical protein BEL05_04895 [Shewanella colwelliana]